MYADAYTCNLVFPFFFFLSLLSLVYLIFFYGYHYFDYFQKQQAINILFLNHDTDSSFNAVI
jgi:hypothetical protein